MAQPLYAVKYLGAKSLQVGKTYTSADLLTEFSGATCLIMKTSGVSVSINGTDMFPIVLNDQSFLETGLSYTFNKDCIVAVGIYKVVS